MAKKATKKKASKKKTTQKKPVTAKFPRHSVEQALRIPSAILEQNAGKACTVKEAANFLGLGASGPFRVEVSSATKFGFLDRPETGKLKPTDLAKQILRPQSEQDALRGYRAAILVAPDIVDVYKHYRGENLPDQQFLRNTLVDTYGIPAEKVDEFEIVFRESLETAKLLKKYGDKVRVLDITEEEPTSEEKSERIKKLGKEVVVTAGDNCFVMQPFEAPYGNLYERVYKPAIEKAGLHPIRADADIFGTGKIIDQVWRGINNAKVLVAELTSRNPNVFYELGLAHALEKPVVLISSNEDDVPFDLHHIRVDRHAKMTQFRG